MRKGKETITAQSALDRLIGNVNIDDNSINNNNIKTDKKSERERQ
jgi:hypothetical protein